MIYKESYSLLKSTIPISKSWKYPSLLNVVLLFAFVFTCTNVMEVRAKPKNDIVYSNVLFEKVFYNIFGYDYDREVFNTEPTLAYLPSKNDRMLTGPNSILIYSQEDKLWADSIDTGVKINLSPGKGQDFFWLSPEKLSKSIQFNLDTLGRLVPALMENTNQGFADWQLRLEVLEKQVMNTLNPINKKRFAVYDNILSHFINDFGLWKFQDFESWTGPLFPELERNIEAAATDTTGIATTKLNEAFNEYLEYAASNQISIILFIKYRPTNEMKLSAARSGIRLVKIDLYDDSTPKISYEQFILNLSKKLKLNL